MSDARGAGLAAAGVGGNEAPKAQCMTTCHESDVRKELGVRADAISSKIDAMGSAAAMASHHSLRTAARGNSDGEWLRTALSRRPQVPRQKFQRPFPLPGVVPGKKGQGLCAHRYTGPLF